jgi:hypothetical protein
MVSEQSQGMIDFFNGTRLFSKRADNSELLQIRFRMSNRPMIITPFQIFCHQTRDQAVRLHPHARGIAVTHILGQMWRGLDPATRSYFTELSLQMRGNPKAKVPEARTPVNPLRIPMLGILPHKSFGHLAAEVSERILLAGHCPPELF